MAVRERRRRSTLAVDARNRALRTFVIGLAIDVLVALTAVLVTVTSSAEAWQGWAALGLSLARTVVQTAGAYVLRRYADPSSLPTPLPPGPPLEEPVAPVDGARHAAPDVGTVQDR